MEKGNFSITEKSMSGPSSLTYTPLGSLLSATFVVIGVWCAEVTAWFYWLVKEYYVEIFFLFLQKD